MDKILVNAFVMGVAGNTPGHLEQVGETEDFKQIDVAGINDPKCIFPIYTPNISNEITSIYPLSANLIKLPLTGEVQMEPEVALICDVDYEGEFIKSITPRAACAFNDCSIRIPDGEEKISRRKNWGVASKGISNSSIKLSKFATGGDFDNYRLCAFLKRDGVLHEYAIDSAVTSYTFFNEKLLNWIVNTLNTQKDFRNVDDMLRLIAGAGKPEVFVISIGAIEYTKFGEHGFLKAGDEGVIALYDCRTHTKSDIEKRINSGETLDVDGLSAMKFVHE